MATIYVSPTGSDSGPGTESEPWRTLTRLNAAFESGELALNDQVYLKRGSTFYGRLVLPDTIDPAYPGWLRVGAYGTGDRPIISGYKLLNIASGWTVYDANTWQINISTVGVGTVYTGYDDAQGNGGGDVGFIKVDGVIFGRKRSSLGGLTGQWDFYSSGTILYVRSTANPTSLASDIRVVVDGAGADLRSGVELRDIHITGHGEMGISGPGRGGTTRARVYNCEVSEIGGSYLDGYGDGTVRYGNGIQCWTGASDVIIENNIVHDVYDVAFSLQGGDEGAYKTFNDITFRRNLVYRNSQSFEFWYSGTGTGFESIIAEYNTCLFAGYGWGGDVRPETESRVHLLTFSWNHAADLIMRRNIFYDARTAYRFNQVDPDGLVLERNIILLRPGTLMQYQTSETIEQALSWATDDGRDTDSRFVTLPASSDIVISDADVSDSLAYLSSVHTGQVVPVADGFRLVTISGSWSIGT